MAMDLDRIDIVEVAKKLGIQVSRSKRADQTLALCPFHKESTPSLALFHPRGSERSHYHCFGCQAHGGVLDLIIEKGAKEDYAGAFGWLRDNGFLTADTRLPGAGGKVPTEGAAVKAFLEAAQKNADPALLRTFAESRRFDPKILSAAGVLAVDLGPSVLRLDPDKDETRLLVKLGLVRRANIPIFGHEPGNPSLLAFANGPRIVIPIRDINGTYVSVMARASRYDQEPKYKFPAKFERGNHLFGLHEVVAELRVSNGKNRGRFFDLYLVEGVFDALRLRSVGKYAAACFGASITHSQIRLLEQVAEIAAGQERTLRLHLFLDADRAGRDGTARALARLLGSAAERGYLIDVVRPPGGTDTAKEDPDSWIAERQAEGVEIDLDKITHPALHALVASYLDDSVAIERIPDYWQRLTWPEKFALQQRLNRRLKEIDYNSVRNAIRPDLTSLAVATAGEDVPPTPLSQDLERMAVQRSEPTKADPQRDLFAVKTLPLSTRLQDSIELAYEASSSREYPVDVGSWERLRKAAMVFVPLLEVRLREADPPIRPFTAHYVPRSNSKPRLKCGPCPEDAILQQHFLVELLKLNGDLRRLEKVPAVRWWPARREIQTTGRGDANGETVSFGYQIDMSALEGRPDRRGGRRDIFRPFIECWNGYIASIGRRLARMPGGIVHVARLDIGRFYDETPRWLIRRKLEDILGTVLSIDPEFGRRLGFSDAGHDEQLDRIRDWVLAHSFGRDEEAGYSYIDPQDGQVRSWGRPGRGLPQGPPLSAYLATICLFDLDKRMVEEVARIDQRVRQAENRKKTDERRCGAVYARYVDDIILMASSEMDLRHLLNCVSHEVSKAGLRLNEKSEVLLPKTIAEAREWLVERRGNGAGYDAGGVQEMPAPVHEVASSWADIPGLDRRHLLAAVLDPTLDDPALKWEAAWKRLSDAVKAGDELRESDHGFFSRRLLMRVMLRREFASNMQHADWHRVLPPLAKDIAEHWMKLVSGWRQPFQPDTEDGDAEQAAHEALHNSAPLLTLFDGVERMLAGRPEMNPSFSDDAKVTLRKARRAFVQAVRHGLLDHVRDAVLKGLGNQALVLRAQLAQHQIILEERADISYRQAEFKTGFELGEQIGRRRSPLDHLDNAREVDRCGFWRLEPSWHRSFNAHIEGDHYPAIDRSRDALVGALRYRHKAWEREVPFAALHSGLSLLQALALPSAHAHAVENDTAARAEVASALEGIPIFGSAGMHVEVANVLQTWFGDVKSIGRADGQTIVNAAFAFCLLLKGAASFSSLLQERRPVIRQLSKSESAELLPPPPLADGQHLLFREGPNLIGVQLVHGGAKDDFPPDIAWDPGEDISAVDGFRVIRRTAKIPEGFAFLPHGIGEAPQFDLTHVADFVDALMDRAGREHTNDPDTALVVTPYSILYRVLGDGAHQRVDIKLAAWRVPVENVHGLAFRRSGKALLAQRTPHPVGDWLWRAGTAVADVLGAVACAADSTDVVAEEAALSPDQERLQAILRRKLFSRVQGYHLPPTVNSVDLENGRLPRHLSRTLEALRTASREGGDGALPAIVQHFIEGRAMMLRSRTPVALESVATGVAGMLAQLGRESLNANDELFRGASAPSGCTLGRSAEAYRRVAHVLDRLAVRALQPEVRKGLHIAAVGTRLWAMTVAWREFALALLARLDAPVRQSLMEMQPELAKWGLEGSVFLVKPRLGWKDADASEFWMQLQVTELGRTLTEAFTAARAVDVRAALDRVTLLGWVVVAGMATASLPFVPPRNRDRAALALTSVKPAAEDVAIKLAELATILASGSSSVRDDKVADWPWELFSHLADRAPDVLAEATLVAAASVAGIEWASPAPESKVLTDLDSLEGRFSYTPKGSASAFRPGHWRLAYTAVPGETKSRPETWLDDRDQEMQVWTVVQDASTKEALVISVASNALVRQSGLGQSVAADGDEPNEPTIEVGMDLAAQAKMDEEPTTSALGGEADAAENDAPLPLPPSAQAGSGGNAPPTNNPGEETSAAEEPSPPKLSAEEMNAILREWLGHQKAEWKKRKYDPGNSLDRSYFRFAFLQTDFAEGYEDPKIPEGHLKIGETEHCPAELCWPSAAASGDLLAASSGKRKLCLDEWRRRQVLMRVVEACTEFGVEVLLLPEYSMRAETVLWLAGYLEEKGASLSVWAGTFRVPSKFQVHVDQAMMRGSFVAQGSPERGEKVWRPLDAVLPVIFRDHRPNLAGSSSGSFDAEAADEQADTSEAAYLLNRLPKALLSRCKRFPALAYEEIFRPPSVGSQLHPIMQGSRNIARAESFVTELICSEIFAFNGPTNIEQIAANLVALNRKFSGVKLDEKNCKVLINNYNDSFSAYVAHGIPGRNRPRRTIIMLPCITKRAKDYHAFGTTLHLSASSNIIFCNSSLENLGGGESCVIGFRSWDEKPNKSKMGPYHGVLPGLYVPSDGDGIKPLGTKERALVIVDLEPFNPALPHPRPQYVPEPVRLVAHLPILEYRAEKVRPWRVKAAESGQVTKLAGQALKLALCTLPSTLTLALPEHNKTCDEMFAVLNDLSKLYPDSPALKKRADSFMEAHGGMPEAWPPPVLTDWLAVDLDIAGFKECIRRLHSMPREEIDRPIEGPGFPLIWVDPPA